MISLLIARSGSSNSDTCVRDEIFELRQFAYFWCRKALVNRYFQCNPSAVESVDSGLGGLNCLTSLADPDTEIQLWVELASTVGHTTLN